MDVKDLDIAGFKGITQDSRAVKPEYLFAALPGTHVDGADYIDQAIQNGATCILSDEGVALIDNRTHIRVSNPRLVYAQIAAKFYAPQPENIVAVTGTNGKSSVVEFTHQIWKKLGIKSAALGTLGLHGDGIAIDGNMTTPEPSALHNVLRQAKEAGINHIAMEASSHGLDQCRMHGVSLKVAGFTNLSHDHLDYHGDMESYFQAKAKLFDEVLDGDGVAVINADIPQFEALKKKCLSRRIQVVDYGENAYSLKVLSIEPTPQGQRVRLEVNGERVGFETSLVGVFQVYNMLCALGLAMADQTLEPQEIGEILSDLKPVRGRLEAVAGHPSGAGIYVDYAHTPDALEKVLMALRAHTSGRLICVFGCGGDRDKTKRPEMGEIVAKHADHVIVTDDNPRSEDPNIIRADIMKSAPQAQEISGRRVAIQAAVKMLRQGDVLVVAGKGHEQGQIFADRTEDFDDVSEVKFALSQLS